MPDENELDSSLDRLERADAESREANDVGSANDERERTTLEKLEASTVGEKEGDREASTLEKLEASSSDKGGGRTLAGETSKVLGAVGEMGKTADEAWSDFSISGGALAATLAGAGPAALAGLVAYGIAKAAVDHVAERRGKSDEKDTEKAKAEDTDDKR